MDQQPPKISGDPSNPKPNRLRALAFLEIGLFEIGFVAVVLLLIFGALNYFNILPVSEVFPNQLGWLPRQQTKLASQGQTLRGSDNLAKSNASPSPANFTPAQEKVPTGTFQYDTAKAKTLLTEYIKSTLKPSHLPSTIDIRQGNIINKNMNNPNLFHASFSIQEFTGIATFSYEEDTNIPRAFGIAIEVKNLPQSSKATSLANSLLSSYFSAPYSISNCKQSADLIFCENFQTASEGKKGYGLTIFGAPPKSINSFFTCFTPKENVDYLTAKSCADF